MSRDRGIRLQNALARYLTQWWPHAESAGSGRPGTDILGTPGIVWECKTAREFRPAEWCRQASHHVSTAAEVPVVVYFPDGMGEKRTEVAIAMMPLTDMVQLLWEAGYRPDRIDVPVSLKEAQ
jgi:hypothetical protein